MPTAAAQRTGDAVRPTRRQRRGKGGREVGLVVTWRARIASSHQPTTPSNRRGGGREAEAFRASAYANATWWRAHEHELTKLAHRNALDIELYEWAAARSRAALAAHWRATMPPDAQPMPPLPPLPCSREPGSYCWDAGGPPVDATVPVRRRLVR